MNLRVNYKVEDFLRDDSFICYVLDGSSETDSNWECLLKEHPELAKTVQQAVSILTGEDREYRISMAEIEEWKRELLECVERL